MTERFTAWCTCPRCDLFDCHRLREPNPAPALETIKAWTKVVRLFELIAPSASPPMPMDESIYEVIRICNCGNEWGQT